MLFNTLLAGSDGLEDGLINPDKAWCGSRRFGMSFYDPRSSGLASIGTVLEIKRHERLDDGRLLVENVGGWGAQPAALPAAAIAAAGSPAAVCMQ